MKGLIIIISFIAKILNQVVRLQIIQLVVYDNNNLVSLQDYEESGFLYFRL